MVKYKPIGYGESADNIQIVLPTPNQNGNKQEAGSNSESKTQPASGFQQNDNPVTGGVIPHSTGTENPNDAAPTTPAGDNQGYQENDAVKQAQEMLQQQLSGMPGAYQSQWQTQIDDIIGKIMNREPFHYDLNGDALYDQYKDQYVMQGQQAMMDTMGRAATLTGGYGNSYAQTAGQQAYYDHLQDLNDIVPDLYQMALDQYLREGQDMYDQFSVLAQQDSQDYDRYRDQIADEQWQKEYEEAIRQFNHKNGITTSTGGSGDTGDTGDTGGTPTGNPQPQPGTYDNGSLSTGSIIALQKALGVEPDGKWGPESQAAAQKKWGITSADEAYEKHTGVKSNAYLSTGGQNFVNNMPYAHGGSDINVWKSIVTERLQKAYESGTVTESDVEIILKKYGLV